ncbi:YceI family protein [Tamlana sp. 2201CG12-4]|uniref:YceI family protein n=1 Tax=Tamlana sp. 2201CG12-4 TaxID=3112582 RepID=UPI002DBB9AEF|nr:YceI family protein [Tamlana sp. 2201CG12-4]MEC3907566.1 YceI family protein [Tamlana sp. 2201CG12-4]
MKRNLKYILLVMVLIVSITACKDKAREATTIEATTPDNTEKPINPETYTAIATESIIEWKGSKPTGTHHGTVAIENGTLEIANGNIVGGSFNIDMTSIVVKDIPADDKKNAKLQGHLKSPDFFNVEAHPNATFTITGSEKLNGKTTLSGNLIIKAIKNDITFPVSVTQNNGKIALTSEPFSIDRSKWDVRYGSKSFFDNLGDKFINNDIELKISIKASKS